MNSPLDTLSQALLSAINNAILVVGPDDTIFFANSKAARLFQANELSGQSIARLFMPDDQDILLPNLLHLGRLTQEFEEEVMLRRQDGSRFIARLAMSRLQTEAGLGIIFSIHNISDRKRMEKALRRTERIAALGNMLDDINHQVRNPISIIGGFAKRLQRLPGADTRYVRAIIEAAERLEALLDSLRDFSRLAPAKVTPMPMRALIEAIHSHIVPRVQGLGGQLKVRCAPELPYEATISIDLPLLLRAIAALTDNACEATTGQPVVVEIAPSGRQLPHRISIIDQGNGIPPTDRFKVFAPFFTRKTSRHGMGLTLAQRIISEQGGEISLDSQEGLGTTAHIFLAAERRRPIRTQRLACAAWPETTTSPSPHLSHTCHG